MADVSFSDMPFSQFATAVRPTAAVNRFPPIGSGQDVFSYSVYLNGEVAQALPEGAQEQVIVDVTLHALTEKLGFDSASARNNLKVAELVTLRNAWMHAVLEASMTQPLSKDVNEDYEQLTNGMSHPVLVSELNKQRILSANLQPALVRAGVLKDIVPKEISIGKVIAQDADFTMQKTRDGEVVTHENRRLAALPVVGADVTVSYYRGKGQVVDSLENVKISTPFIDPKSDDLAVVVNDGKKPEQVILFNSMLSFSNFVKAHGLDAEVVKQAIDVREASPRAGPPLPERDPVRPPYIDTKAWCLAIDYKEAGVTYTALFESAGAMDRLSHEFKLDAKSLDSAKSLEADLRLNLSPMQAAKLHEVAQKTSLTEVQSDLAKQGYKTDAIQTKGVDGQTYSGRVVSASGALHVAMDVGRGKAVIFDVRDLDKAVTQGDKLTVKMVESRGRVTEVVKAGKDMWR